jgi:glyoxylase-like metal-dependent hydrolase (beta-lactamase superfamily II)
MEVFPGIHEIKTRASNCYLVVGDDVMLIDTGMPGNSSKIIDYLQNTLKRNPQDIKTIIITHHHFDHVGSLDKIKKITGAKVAIHLADANYVSGNENQTGPVFMIAMVNLMKFIYRTEAVEADILLEDGDQIGDYQVIHTPGHTPGSICLYNPQNKVIFVGDNLRYSKGKINGPSPRLLPEPEEFKESIKKLSCLDIDVILSGHSPPVTFDAALKLEEYLKNLID